MYRRRTIPYKILYYLLYGRENWLSRLGNSEVRVETGKMARALRVSNSRLLEAINYLLIVGILDKVEKPQTRGVYKVKLKKPEGLD